MPTSSGLPAGHASKAVSSVLRNPELMAEVYLELEQSDLAQCVRVNRQMHAGAAKALYHAVQWPKFRSLARPVARRAHPSFNAVGTLVQTLR
jgi:hypothetical protein